MPEIIKENVRDGQEDHLLSSYDYDLPDTSVAQTPADRRDGSRLAVLPRSGGAVVWTLFEHLAGHLPPGALLVANNSRVFPARLLGAKPSGGRVEFLLLTPLPMVQARPGKAPGWLEADVEGLARASRGPRPGEVVEFSSDFRLTVTERGDFGRVRGVLAWTGDLSTRVEALGRLPLPPYIRHEADSLDLERYQTLHARPDKAGSVAAPTAGLHFTPAVRESLRTHGFDWCEATLYVGYGTFSPVRTPDIRNHAMHREWLELPGDTARAVLRAKAEGRPVVAVGTTSARILEGVARARGGVEPWSGETDIFISPGYEFQVVDGLITNFHLPRSSLLMLVSALAGRERILDAYREALSRGFRFFSYGDAMLLA